MLQIKRDSSLPSGQGRDRKAAGTTLADTGPSVPGSSAFSMILCARQYPWNEFLFCLDQPELVPVVKERTCRTHRALLLCLPPPTHRGKGSQTAAKIRAA